MNSFRFWVFFIVFLAGGVAAVVYDRNWVGGLILVGIGLYPLLWHTRGI